MNNNPIPGDLSCRKLHTPFAGARHTTKAGIEWDGTQHLESPKNIIEREWEGAE
jgi:hypothetical protein